MVRNPLCNFEENNKYYKNRYIPRERFLDPPPPPPPINFVHGPYMVDMDIIDHVAAALGPPNLSSPQRSAQEVSQPN